MAFRYLSFTRVVRLLVLLSVGCLGLTLPAEARQWNENDGTSYYAEVVDVNLKDNVITLEKSNGSRIIKPLSNFSEVDRSYARKVKSGQIKPVPFGRVWTNTKGAKLRAVFVEVLPDNRVRLRSEDGKISDIPMTGLSAGDIAIVRQASAPPPPPVAQPSIDEMAKVQNPPTPTSESTTGDADVWNGSGGSAYDRGSTPSVTSSSSSGSGLFWKFGNTPAQRQAMAQWGRRWAIPTIALIGIGALMSFIANILIWAAAFREGCGMGLAVLIGSFIFSGLVTLIYAFLRLDECKTALSGVCMFIFL